MDMTQQVTRDPMESSHGKLDYGTPTDDEEVMLPPHDRATEVPDFPDMDIRDRQTLLDTQRKDWLLQTEPLHGARPRQTSRQRPLVMEDRPPMEATGGVDGLKLDHNRIQAPLLSPGRQILMEEEVITPPRGGSSDYRKPGFTTEGGGAVRPLSLRGHHAGCEQCLNIFTEGRSRDIGLDRQKYIGLPVDILVDTVARMQQALARLREENHLFRTSGTGPPAGGVHDNKSATA